MDASNILFAVENGCDLTLLEELFDRNNTTVHRVGSGEEALATLHAMPFEIMLTDMVMPDMDAITLARRARRVSPGLTVFMYTDLPTRALRREISDAGIERIFDKPLSPNLVGYVLREARRASDRRNDMNSTTAKGM
ncbi:response regulator [Geobacter sulfurreducens]|uniref:response regulator n=1 Tax=Geobacter sulfurreducens TaxID=35554 RepID=UPI0020B743E0|nr:response regulator [Geobacter sulfurreducens]UTG93526.1 response regulator [Geobacter sulfurreducens]